MGASYHIVLIVWSCFECILVSAIIFGWAQLLEVLEREQYFSSYCDDVDARKVYNATTLNIDRTCNKQDSLLNLVYSFASFSTSISIFLGGKCLDSYGFTKTRVLSCLIYLMAGILVYISTLGFHVLLFPGLILTCTGGSFFMACLVQVCGFVPRRRGTVVSLINASIDLSAIMLLICKLTYRAGLPFKTIVIVYYTFSVVHGLVFTFTFFPKSYEPKRVVLTLENKPEKECCVEDKPDIEEKETNNCSASPPDTRVPIYSTEIIFQPNDFSTIIENKVGAEECNKRSDSPCSTVSEGSEMLEESWSENETKTSTLENYHNFHSNEILYSQLDGYSTVIGNKLESSKEDVTTCSSTNGTTSYSSYNEIPYYRADTSCTFIQNEVAEKDENDVKLDSYFINSDTDDNNTSQISFSSNELPYLQTNENATKTEENRGKSSRSLLSLPGFSNIHSFENLYGGRSSFIIGNKTWGNAWFIAPPSSILDENTMVAQEEKNLNTSTSTSSLIKTKNPNGPIPKCHTAVQKDETFWEHVKTPKYILHTAFTSVIMLRTLTFVGMLNLNLKRLTSDPEEVDLYLTIFATILLVEILLCFFPGTLLDWNPKGKYNDYSMILSFFLTNCLGILLTSGLIIPSLKLQQKKIGWMKQEERKEIKRKIGQEINWLCSTLYYSLNSFKI